MCVPQPLLEEREHVVVVEGVEHVTSVAPASYDPGAAQQSELVGHGRLREPKGSRQVLNAHLGPREHIEDPHPGRVAEHPENLGQVVYVGRFKN